MAERLPRYGFVRRAVRRFMPGERPEDALVEAERFQAGGASTLLTLLGENADSAADAGAVVDHYLGVLGEVRRRGLDAEVSVKLTQLGVDVDDGLALESVRTLVKASAGTGVAGTAAASPLTLWIDMESSAYVDRTLDIYRTVRREHANVGVALQAYLRRTEADLDSLLPLEPSIRLVKGAYLEPPDVAHTDKATVDSAYRRLGERLLKASKAGRMGRSALATHDGDIVRDLAGLARELALPRAAFEFEMLYGIGVSQQRQLLSQGHPLRVLISYGEAWFPWYMRRLAERPANLWFVVKQMVKG